MADNPNLLIPSSIQDLGNFAEMCESSFPSKQLLKQSEGGQLIRCDILYIQCPISTMVKY